MIHTAAIRRARWQLIALVAAVAAVGALLWRFTPLQDMASADRLAAWLGSFRESAWSPVAVIAIFVIGGLIVFPLTLLITATAVVFAPVTAVGLSLAGSLANAAALYALGARFVRRTAHTAFGPTLEKVNGALADRSVVAIAVLRMIPIAPFTLVNLAAGSVGVRFRAYIVGTALGLVPGIVVLTAFGRQLRAIWENPTLANVVALIAVVLVWIGLSLLLQRITSARKRRSAPPGDTTGR